MFNRYYQSELTYLRELGREFSEANPELADLFSDKGGDPDVERLLEGFAFLTARIRERIDDSVPEMIGALSQLLLPHYLRPLPACTIVQFTPSQNALRSRHTIEAGAELGSRPVEGTSCLFRTVRDLDLLPLALDHVSLDSSQAASPRIRMSFRCFHDALRPVFEGKGIELYFNGPLPQASMWNLWMQRHLRSVSYVCPGRDVIRLDAGAMGAPALDGGGCLFPWPRLAPTGPRLLQQYYALPQSMFFARLPELATVPAEHRSAQFDLLFEFADPPPMPERVETEQVQLGCVPAVNLFDRSADPIVRDPQMREYLLRPAGVDPRHADIYAVREVIGIRSRRRDRIHYTPFFDFTHAELAREQQAYYTVRPAVSPLDDGLDTYLSVQTPRDVPLETGDETLSLDVTCTNRRLPTELRVGDVSVPTPRSPTIARFRNLTGVTQPVQPPLGSELHWRLVAHIGLNQRSIADAKALQALLKLYNFHDTATQQGRANELRATSIRAVEVRPARRMVQGEVVRGMHTRVELEEGRVSGRGDAFALGCTLDALFASHIPINTFNQLTLVLHPSMTEIPWAPRTGNQALI